MSEANAAVLGLLVLVLMILGFWKLIEIVYYLFQRIFRRKDFEIRKRIRKAKRAK